MKSFFDANPYTAMILIWLFTTALMCFLVDGATLKVRRIKRGLVCFIVTLMIWGTVMAGLIDASKLMPSVPQIKSPTIESHCTYTVKP